MAIENRTSISQRPWIESSVLIETCAVFAFTVG